MLVAIPFDSLALYSRHGDVLRCSYAEGRGAELLSHLAIPLDVGVSGWVAANGKPLLNGNALTEFGVSGLVPPGFDLQSGLAVALDAEYGSAAVLTLYSRQREAFTMDHLRILLAIESWLAYYLRLNSCGLTAADAAMPKPPLSLQLAELSKRLRESGVEAASVTTLQQPVADRL